ncbi:acyltransferase [Aeromonas veronii]|nr:acyltransferase [Aeromonas veronii]
MVGTPRDFKIGCGSHIKSNTFIECSGGVTIGDYFHTGRGLTIFSTNHNWKNPNKIPYDEVTIKKPVIIGDFVWCGANVTILPGTVIGDGVIIAAGSVVRGAVPALSIVAGNPCEIVGVRNKDSFEILRCERRFF